MKTMIKITKQEAIDAWKMMNSHIAVGEDTTVEIEEMSIGIGSFTYNPTVLTTNQCPMCGECIGNAIHQCKGYRTTC